MTGSKRPARSQRSRKEEDIDEGTDDMQHYESDDDEEDDDDSIIATSDKKKLLVKDVLGDKYDWQLTEFVGPEIPRVKPDSKYFVPSTDHVDIAMKLEEGQVPRFPEEEGMYIGERPKVKKANQNKLENRILREQAEADNRKRNCWFGQDGRLIALPNPIQRMSTRPLSLESNQEPLTVYCYPTMSMTEGQSGFGGIPVDGATGSMRWSGGSPPHCQLDIDIGSVVFNHHHLFSLEHYLVTKMIEIYNTYQTVRSIQSSKGLEQRLNVLYRSLEELKHKMDKWSEEERGFQEQRLRSYTEELRLLREERDDESLKEKELMRSILNLWKILKDVRLKQGYSNTSHKIVVHKEQFDKQADKEVWDKELKRQLEDAKEFYNTERQKLINTFEKDLQQWQEVNGKNILGSLFVKPASK